MANSSASELVTNTAWWTVFMREQLAWWMCEINVAISFLMLASVTIRAVFGEEEIQRTKSSSSCMWVLSLSFSFLLAKLK